MASPQKENGFTPIANEILEALYAANLNATQFKIVLLVVRYTYGFNRKEHSFSLNFLSTGTGVSRRYISSELKSLIDAKVITVVKEHTDTEARLLTFNKDHEGWCISGRIVQQVKDCSTGEAEQDTTDEEPFTPTDEELFTQERKVLKTTINTPSGKKNKEPNFTKEAIDYYHDKFLEKFNEKPNINGSKDGALFKKVINTYGIEKVKVLLDRLFESDEKFIRESGYTVGVFYSQVNKLITMTEPEETDPTWRPSVREELPSTADPATESQINALYQKMGDS